MAGESMVQGRGIRKIHAAAKTGPARPALSTNVDVVRHGDSWESRIY